jgi:hypothetical protein
MSLAVGRIKIEEINFADTGAAITHWDAWPASRLARHGAACCEAAREWVFAFDLSLLGSADALTGPRWLRHKFKWGPSPWPLHWCEAVRREALDCGALAALAREIFEARGVRAFPAQLVQQYTDDSARHWRRNWDGEEIPSGWIRDELIYHEACAVLAAGDEIKVWDPTASWWVNPRQFGGYGSLLALRLLTDEAAPRAGFRWGAHRVAPNRWQRIERARPDFA